MLRRIVLLSCALLLAACQSNSINRDFDAQRDFAGYRSWSWKELVCSTSRMIHGSGVT